MTAFANWAGARLPTQDELKAVHAANKIDDVLWYDGGFIDFKSGPAKVNREKQTHVGVFVRLVRHIAERRVLVALGCLALTRSAHRIAPRLF